MLKILVILNNSYDFSFLVEGHFGSGFGNYYNCFSYILYLYCVSLLLIIVVAIKESINII